MELFANCRGDSLQRRFATLRHTRSGQKDTRTTKTGDHQWLTHKHCLVARLIVVRLLRCMVTCVMIARVYISVVPLFASKGG